MGNDNINAEWARTQSNKMSSIAISQLEQCLEQIKDAVLRNETNAHLRIKIEHSALKNLQDRGFKVQEKYNQYDGDSINITW